MAAIEVKSAALAFPVCANDSTGLTSVGRITAIAASAASSLQLPNDLKGKFIRVRPVGSDIQCGVSFGSAGLTLTASPANTNFQTSTSGATAKDGEFLDGVVPSFSALGNLYLNYINVGASTCTIEIWCSEAVKP